MTREEAKELLPIIQAFAEGKVIQCRSIISNEWRDFDEPAFNGLPDNYRIKPESKFRPFKSQEECWNEMHKHPDFGWVVAKDSKIMYHVGVVGIGYVVIDSMSPIFSEAFADYEFTDGKPFGVREE